MGSPGLAWWRFFFNDDAAVRFRDKILRNIDAMALQSWRMGTCCLTQSFKFVLPSIRNDDRRSFFQKRDAYSTTEATGTSGHQGKLPLISFAHGWLQF
jgi:hypothetical protein